MHRYCVGMFDFVELHILIDHPAIIVVGDGYRPQIEIDAGNDTDLTVKNSLAVIAFSTRRLLSARCRKPAARLGNAMITPFQTLIVFNLHNAIAHAKNPFAEV